MSFLNNLQRTQQKVANYQKQITTQSKINKPSDSPTGNARIMRLGGKVTTLGTYSNNIDNSLSLVNSTISALDGIQSEIQKVRSDLTSMSSAVEDGNLELYAQNIDTYLSALLDFANTQTDGQYLFGGTSGQKPFGFNASGTAIEVKSSDISGEHKVKISDLIKQTVNIPGDELFLSITSQNGNLDSTSAVGSTNSGSTTIFDADGNEYTLNLTYTKTAANSYSLDYSVVDSTSTTVYNNSAALVFDSTTGELASIDGSDPAMFSINVPANKLDFRIDVTNMKETSSSASLSIKQNQKADIFNTLLSIRDKLNNGERPNENQIAIIESFDSHLLNKMSKAGSIQNRLEDTQAMLENQSLTTQTLLSKESDVDIAEATVYLQNEEYNLQLSYQLSSMILPKSLLDYL